MMHDLSWLQSEAERLGSWNKVSKMYGVSPSTVSKYKQRGLIKAVQNFSELSAIELAEIQAMYDSGMSIRKIAAEKGIPHSQFSHKINTRSKIEARKMSNHSISAAGRLRLSESAKKNGLGGYRPHPNRGVWYNGIWLDSLWEERVAKSLDSNGVRWERPRTGLRWTDSGKKYYPDFYLVDYDIFLDPKNEYLQKQDIEKIHQAQIRNGVRVLVLTESQLNWEVIQTLL